MILQFLSDPPVLIALVPFAGVLAIRELRSRRQVDAGARSREDRARLAHHEALRAMQEALEAEQNARRSRDEFLARMSHELRTPLNAVIGFSRVLQSNRAGNQRPEDLQLIGRVRAGGEHLLRLVQEVLDQSHIESGKLALDVGATDVAEVVTRVARNYRSAAAAKGLRLLLISPESSPPIQLDAGRFEQVVEHLVDNAVKFTPSGTIKLTLVTDAATRCPSRLTIADTGIGIAADQREEIFVPFAQADASKRRSYGGAGLGLPIARQLCERMGCSLGVQSEIGVGSRFTIRFS